MLVDFLVRLKPLGPWRLGSPSGVEDATTTLLHSDSLYSALCAAFHRLGSLEEWLAATAVAPEGPEVTVSSLFPCQGPVYYVIPPRTVWPPVSPGKVRWKGARFVPLALIGSLLRGAALDEALWIVDGPSGCLVPLDAHLTSPGPFRISQRTRVTVDRLDGLARHSRQIACLEFSAEGGLWTAVAFASAAARHRWKEPVQAAFRLLADDGIGGQRSQGWGHAAPPEFVESGLPSLLTTPAPPAAPESGNGSPAPGAAYWLLSLFTPATGASPDPVDWDRGVYEIIERSGRIDSPLASPQPGRRLRMIAEGSVLYSAALPRGAAHDVAPPGFPHPVYRAGFAFAIPLPEGP